MQITTKYGTLQVDRQTEISLTITNPFLNDQGSHSLPFTVPWNKHNLMVLGHPERHYNAKPPYTNILVTIKAENFVESGHLNILNIPPQEGIELSFLTREGMFWNWAKNTRLRDIFIPYQPMPSENLVHYFPFNSISSIYIFSHNSKLNSNNASLPPSGVTRVDGLSIKALHFDGTSGVTGPYYFPESGAPSANISISVWIKAAKGNPTARTIFSQDNGLRRLTIEANDSIQFLSRRANGSTYVIIGSSIWEANEWTHIVAIQKNNSLFLYINNELVASNTYDDIYTIFQGSYGIGSYPDGSTNPFLGIIDEFRTYSDELSLADIDKLFRNNTIPFLEHAYFHVNVLNHYNNKIWPDADFAFFPIASEKIGDKDILPASTTHGYIDVSNYLLFNRPSKFFQESPYAEEVTPFFYVNAVIKWIADSSGLRLENNFLASSDELKSLVVLNKSYYKLSDEENNYPFLLPDCSILDFISSLEDIFCCRFFINTNKKTIDIISFNEIKLKSPKPVSGILTVKSFIEKESLQFKPSIPDSEYTSFDESTKVKPYDDFETLTYVIHDNFEFASPTANPDLSLYPNKLVFCEPLQLFFLIAWREVDDLFEYRAKAVHSSFLKHNNSGFKLRNIDIKASLAPMVPVHCRHFYSIDSKFEYKIIVPLIPSWDNNKKNLYSWSDYFSLSKFYDHSEDQNNSSPIIFAFNRGFNTFILTPNDPAFAHVYPYASIPTGSTDVYRLSMANFLSGSELIEQSAGAKITTASLALRYDGDQYNLYDNLYSEYADMFENSPHELSLEHADLHQLMKFGMSEKLICDSSHILIDTIELSITPGKTKLISCSARSLKKML